MDGWHLGINKSGFELQVFTKHSLAVYYWKNFRVNDSTLVLIIILVVCCTHLTKLEYKMAREKNLQNAPNNTHSWYLGDKILIIDQLHSSRLCQHRNHP